MVSSTESPMQRANEQFKLGKYQAAIELYQQARQSTLLPTEMIDFNIRLCEKKLAAGPVAVPVVEVKEKPPATAVAAADGTGKADRRNAYPAGKETPEVTVTLTTIKSRLPKIKLVLESLHQQTVPPIKIVLNLSKAPYLLDAGVKEDDDDLKELTSLRLLEVNWVENIGPYRKIWPFLEQHFSNSTTRDKLFITVDDDTIYPDHFIATLLSEYEKHDCVVAFRGRHIETKAGQVKPYGAWKIGQANSTLNNLPTGKDGVLYSTKFFTREFLHLQDALDIAPTADDLWIKWHCGTNGVPAIILNPEACTSDYKSFPVVDCSKEYRDVSLYATHNSTASKGKNDLAIERLEDYYLAKYGYNLGTLIGEDAMGLKS